MAAESAVQAAIAGGEAINRSLLALSERVASNADFQQKSIQLRSNILSNMVESAQRLKQTQIDEWYRGESLKLQSKELDIRENQAKIDANFKSYAASIDAKRLEIESEKIDLLRSKQEESEIYKPYVSAIQKQLVFKSNELKNKESSINSQIESIQATLFGRKDAAGKVISKGMRSLDRDLDAKRPDGLHAKLNNLIKIRDVDLAKERDNLSLMSDEIANITSGLGKPGDILPLPKGYRINTNNQMPDDEGGADQNNPLLPKLKTDINQGDIDKAAKTIEDEYQIEFGQLPVDDYENDIPVEVDDNTAIARMFDPDVPIDEAADYISQLSPEGLKKLQKKKNIYAQGFLEAIGAARKFNVKNDSSEAKDAFEHLTDQYLRAGGSREDIITLSADANEKLIELRSQFNVAVDDVAPSEDEVDRKVANAYRVWVRDRYKEQEAQQKASVASDIADGSAILEDITFVPAQYANKDYLDEKGQIEYLRKTNFDIDTDLATSRAKDAAEEKDIIEFNNQFLKGGKFSPISFYNFVSRNPKASSILSSVKRDALADSANFFVEGSMSDKSIKDFSKKQKESILNSIENITLVKAFQVWKNSK